MYKNTIHTKAIIWIPKVHIRLECNEGLCLWVFSTVFGARTLFFVLENLRNHFNIFMCSYWNALQLYRLKWRKRRKYRFSHFIVLLYLSFTCKSLSNVLGLGINKRLPSYVTLS